VPRICRKEKENKGNKITKLFDYIGADRKEIERSSPDHKTNLFK